MYVYTKPYMCIYLTIRVYIPNHMCVCLTICGPYVCVHAEEYKELAENTPHLTSLLKELTK